ncbi:ribonuclease H2 non-catalytic subunit-domain-containing protein [Thermothelomyces heterothallicus CBS 202.75]|uniref:ribonuclease H2 non-catalytic subunit-domain-containing protein n=1 Tax=Thermothelomyces heterothallicus CBS 202.75 TaxID=1149848 RepID=UPI00374361CD
MSQPMLSVRSEKPLADIPKATPHVLPCRVHHNGAAEPAHPFWNPRVNEAGTRTAYFRGRKLRGTAAKLPDNYRGVVATVSAPKQPSRRPEEADVIDLEPEAPPQGSLQVQAEFDEMVVWGHEQPVDAAADPYLRGVEEWLALADKIHSYPDPSTEEKR